MLHLLWDASAHTKRYAEEDGSETVDALYAWPGSQMVVTRLGYAETFATLWRKRNRGAITDAAFQSSASALEAEVLLGTAFRLLATEGSILTGIAHVRRHNLNSSDAAILATCLRYVSALDSMEQCLLIAADQRLLRAATAEGLAALNPELVAATDVSTLPAPP